MKKLLLLASLFLMTTGMFAQTYYQLNVNKSGNVTYESPVNSINSISFGDGTAIFSGTNPITYEIDDIDSITFNTVTIAMGDTVFVTWNGNSAEIINPFASSGVTVNTNGASVVVSSVAENIIYCLSGTSTNGSIDFTSMAGFTLVIRNLNLTSGGVPAIAINSAVNVLMPLQGTSNIADGSGTQDAAFYTDGSITTSGTGTLAVTGNRKHAFNIEGSLTHSTGTLKVNNAQSDAFHIDGGLSTSGSSVIQIANTAADGFDITGNVNIQGGSITINAPGIAARAMRTKGTFTMSSGTLDITATGDTTRAIKSTGKATISGGNVTIDIQGYGAHGISSDTEVAISGSPTVNITSASNDGKAIKSDNVVNISGGGTVARYYIAANFSQDNGILKVDNRQNFNNNIDLKKYGLRANVNVNATKTTEIIVRLQGMFDDYVGPIDGGATTYSKALQASPVLFQPCYEPDEANKYVSHILFGNSGTGIHPGRVVHRTERGDPPQILGASYRFSLRRRLILKHIYIYAVTRAVPVGSKQRVLPVLRVHQQEIIGGRAVRESHVLGFAPTVGRLVPGAPVKVVAPHPVQAVGGEIQRFSVRGQDRENLVAGGKQAFPQQRGRAPERIPVEGDIQIPGAVGTGRGKIDGFLVLGQIRGHPVQ